jgi:hypothetical protein
MGKAMRLRKKREEEGKGENRAKGRRREEGGRWGREDKRTSRNSDLVDEEATTSSQPGE